MSDLPPAKVDGITVDCRDVERLVEFWSTLLGLAVTRSFPEYASLGPIAPGGPALSFQQVPEGKVVKNRLHLDLTVTDLAGGRDFIEDLGGSHVADHQVGDFRWSVMADPEGNEFCIAEHG